MSVYIVQSSFFSFKMLLVGFQFFCSFQVVVYFFGSGYYSRVMEGYIEFYKVQLSLVVVGHDISAHAMSYCYC